MKKNFSERWKEFKKKRKDAVINRALAADGVSKPGMIDWNGRTVSGGGRDPGLSPRGDKHTYRKKKGVNG